MEICQDCKDKLVKFFHFKRTAHEVLSQFKFFQPPTVKVTKKSKTAQSTHKAINNDYQEDLTTGSSYDGDQDYKEPPREPFKIASAVSLAHSNNIEIKEEHAESPDLVFADYSSDFSMPDYTPITSPQRKRPFTRRGDTSKPLSKAAIKMRLYRERLKLPENRARLIIHQQQQREYNRRHYMRKQGVELRRKDRVNYDEDDDDLFIIPDNDNFNDGNV